MVASCGLDKFLRVHHLHNRKLLYKVYLKTALNCLLFSALEIEKQNTPQTDSRDTGVSSDRSLKRVAEEESSEDDDIWDKMDVVTSSSKRKRLRKQIKSTRKKKDKTEVASPGS